jgi:hypothetical protein
MMERVTPTSKKAIIIFIREYMAILPTGTG